MNNWDIYSLVNYIINKEQSGNMLSPLDLEGLLNHHSVLLLRRKLGLGNTNQLDTGYSITAHVDDSVQPFIETDKSIPLTLGKGTLPPDYYYHLSTKFNYIKSTSCNDLVNKEVELERCNKGEFMQRKMLYYSEPTFTFPVFTVSEAGITVLPKEIKEVYMTYVRRPKQCQVIYSIDNDGVITYDEVNSIELEWNDDDKMMIVGSIIESAGINLRSGDLVNASKTIKAGL